VDSPRWYRRPHARTARLDLILLDLGMPKLDGYAIAEQLRKIREPAPLLVAVTGLRTA
jgi:CheY-like chemotaxis protein